MTAPTLTALIQRVKDAESANDGFSLALLAPQLADAAERLQGLLSDMAAHHKGIEWAGDQWGDDCCLGCGHLREGEDERYLAAAYKHQAHPPLTHKSDCKWAELSRRLSEFTAPSRPDTETE